MVGRASWLPGYSRGTGCKLRLFCFPHAGGGAAAFRNWQKAAPPGVEVCPVQLPGRESRYLERFPAGIAELAPQLGDALLPHLDVPFALLGNSMGSLIAFEFARYLRQRYRLSPVRLFVAAAHAPGRARRHAPLSDLPDHEFISALQQRHGGIPREILDQPDFLALYLPVLRADIAMVETYDPAPAPVLACPVTAIAGAADPGVGSQELAPWQEWSTGPFDSLEIEGDHFAVLQHPAVVLTRAYREVDPLRSAAVVGHSASRIA